ncbi:MAG: F0F1 ATP synthase subunit B' [Rhodospirillum sp.]|jgi:F-type H+-transporting ATPase subunit b|nr:F0F1 ATP synthase subunit B' [Rhodospirillum sp.]
MPQFDPTTFAPQLVWLGITFLALYLLMSKLIIPRVSGILAQREDRIDGNLQRAEALKEEAAGVLAAYQKAIADARAQAQSALAKAGADIAAQTAAREAEFAKKMADQTAAAEAGIRAAKVKALADVRGIAAEVAALMAGKITGASVDSGAVAQAVDGVMKERAR